MKLIGFRLERFNYQRLKILIFKLLSVFENVTVTLKAEMVFILSGTVTASVNTNSFFLFLSLVKSVTVTLNAGD